MAYYKKLFFIFLFAFIFILLLNIKSFAAFTFTDINNNENTVPDFPQDDYTDKPYFISNYSGTYCLWRAYSDDAFFYVTNNYVYCSTSRVRYCYYRPGRETTWVSFGTGELAPNSGVNCRSVDFRYAGSTVYTDINKTSIFYSPPNITPPLDISFPTASTNLIDIAQGTDSTIEIELTNYNEDEMPDFLYLNFYKKEGSNYNIYTVPIYIYNQFPNYIVQAPLNDDLFLFVNKSKLYSMGITFSSDDEFYLFLSDDVAPKGYSSWNDNGTGFLLGSTFQTTESTIYDATGLVTIPTLTNNQEQDNQNQSDTQKQIDAINKQTEEQKETKDFLKDDNIDDSNIALPSIQTNDITEDGIDSIFTAIYSGLTNGDARDVVLPFPNTNKSITIPANYTEQFMSTPTFEAIYTLIHAFYWYIIARYIVIDIAEKFEKIKSGDIENVENNNIKTEML